MQAAVSAPKTDIMPDTAILVNNPQHHPARTGKDMPSASTPGDFAVSLGNWIHDHKTITDDNPIGYTVYQYLRSAAASVPYGMSMAGTWLSFDRLAKYGQKLTETAAVAERPFQAGVGKYLHMFTASAPVRTSFMIATSFSLYRATSKLGKWFNETLFNPDDTREQTIDKVEHMPDMLWTKVKEVSPAEFSSTPVSAFALGFVNAVFQPPKELADALIANKQVGSTSGAVKHFFTEVLGNPKTKFVQQCAIYTLGYSLFFELGDRRFKDKQISLGLWEGDSHSIGSASKSHPSLVLNAVPNLKHPLVHKTADSKTDSAADELPEGSRMNDTLSILTSEPSTVRFVLRRMVPTALGISAYTAFKFRGAPLVLGKFTEGLNGIADLPKHAWREGAATTLFFVIPWVTDKYAPAYDAFVDRLEQLVSGKKKGEPIKEEIKLPRDDAARVSANFQQLQQQLEDKNQIIGRG